MQSTKNVHNLENLKKNFSEKTKSGQSQWSVAGFAGT